ncbi:MAG: hypothetical protein ABI835_13105 [Chloroflexota bacterium]
MSLPSNELIKDLYAEFGLTYYESEVLCAGLGIFYALMSFKNVNDMTTPRIEEKLVEVSTLTLGQVVDRVLPLIASDLQIRLTQAVEKRNYFAHYFWYERAYVIQTDRGINEARNLLFEGRQMFEELDQEIEILLAERKQELGITNEVVQAHLERGLAGDTEEPFPSKRPLSRRMIRITEAYNVTFDDRQIALVFETEDGDFLQFCDVGLGWSNFTEVKSNWAVNEALHQYLPASIVPRPEIINSWNYEIVLPQNAILWVKKGKAEKTFKWGIKKTVKYFPK